MTSHATLPTSRIAGLFTADGRDFVSREVEALALTLMGIAGDRHAGSTRRADARTPWHKRGVPIANTRQISLVSIEDCQALSELLDVAGVDPTLLGANIVVEGGPHFGLLPAGSRLRFPSGATIFVTEPNMPCRQPGRKLAQAFDRPELEFQFVKRGVGLRGLVGIVESEGAVRRDDPIKILPALVMRASEDPARVR